MLNLFPCEFSTNTTNTIYIFLFLCPTDTMKEDYEEMELVRVVPRPLKPEEEFELVTSLKMPELSEPNGTNVVFSHVESPGDFSVYEVNDKVLQVDKWVYTFLSHLIAHLKFSFALLVWI